MPSANGFGTGIDVSWSKTVSQETSCRRPYMKKLYERLVKNCATANDFNRLHIAIENRATPDEVHQLSELIDKHYVRTASAKWITTLRGLNDLSKKAEPEDYVRRKIGPNLFFYSNNAPTAAKTLIVGFPGGAGRLMMPVSRANGSSLRPR